MDVETGLLRVAKIVHVLGVGWAVVCAVLGFLNAFGEEGGGGRLILALIAGAVGYGIAWAVAWVIRGFAQKKA